MLIHQDRLGTDIAKTQTKTVSSHAASKAGADDNSRRRGSERAVKGGAVEGKGREQSDRRTGAKQVAVTILPASIVK